MRSSIGNGVACSAGKGFGSRLGYTLIEMAIVISVVGVLGASFASAYSIYLKAQAQTTTENNSSLLAGALGAFLVQNGRYPCPAGLDLDRSDPNYGVETECDPLVTATYPAAANGFPLGVTAGTCAHGLCFEDGQTTVDVDQSPTATTMVIPKIRRGAIPFRALGIPEYEAEDGWGNRFQYAVTENLAVATSYIKTSGGIVVNDGILPAFGGPHPLVPATNLAHYVVFSSGPDKAGAYSHYGKLVNACPTGYLDTENCNTNTTGTNKNAIYTLADYSQQTTGASAAYHFDDFIKFYSAVDTPLWRVADSGGFHIRDLIEAETVGHGVGIGLTNPVAALDVSGEVRAENGNAAMVSQLCDPNGGNCFPVSKFGGNGANNPEFSCVNPDGTTPGGAYATGFSQPTVANSPLVAAGKYIKCSSTSDIKCDPGQIMSGVNADGTLQCTTVASCAAKTLTLCGTTTYTIPAGIKNQVWNSPITGNSYEEDYTCNSGGSGVKWRKTASSGSCTCTPDDSILNVTCNSQWDGNWSGQISTHHVHVCPADTDSTTSAGNTCVCVPITQTQTVACAAGLTGSITQQRDWICDSPTTGHWTPWTNVSNTCTCTANSQTQTLSCPTAYTGTITQQRDFTCPAATWGSWTTTSNTCTCTGSTENQTLGCPANYTGSIQQHRDFDCGSSSWGGWITDANNCTCTASTQSQSITCPGSHQTGSIAQQRTYNCGSGTWGPWADVSNTCSCVADVDTQTVACTAPLVGNITQQRVYDCTAGAWGSWVDVANNCGSVVYHWTISGTSEGNFGSPLAIHSTDVCTPSGAKAECSAPAGGGQYTHYTECTCE